MVDLSFTFYNLYKRWVLDQQTTKPTLINLIDLEGMTDTCDTTACLDFDYSNVPDCNNHVDPVLKQPVYVEHSTSKST